MATRIFGSTGSRRRRRWAIFGPLALVLALVLPGMVSAIALPPTGTGTNHQFEFDGNLRTEYVQPGDLDWALGETNVTTLAAGSNANATNIKVVSVAGMTVGDTLVIGTGASQETRTIQTVGTAGSGGTGVTLTAALALAHASGTTVTDSTATPQTAVIKGVTRALPTSANDVTTCQGGAGSSLYTPSDPNTTPNPPQAPFILGDGTAGQGVLVCDGTISKQTPNDTNGYVSGGHEDQGQNPVRWNIAPASSPKKTDLSEVYTYGMVYNSPFTPADPNADNLLMIFDAGRLDTNGDFHVDFEMNQKGINSCNDTKPPTNDANTSVCQPRTQGDMLVSYDSAGGGQPPVATVFEWKTTLGASETCASSQGDINSPTDKGCYVQLANPPSVNVGGTPYAGAAGVFNSTEIDAAPWRATVCDTTSIQNSSQCTTRDKIPANGNMEGYIDIAAFIPDFNLCPGFGEITARSRSSSGINASLQDTTGGIPVNASICGSIIVKKAKANGDALPGATFTFSPDFLTRDANSTKAVADGGTLDHADGNNGYVCVDNVLFGSYDITETGVPAGYFGDTTTHTVAKSSPSTCADRLDANGVPKDAGDIDATFTNNLGSLLIKKVDGSGNLLPGATFTVTPDPSISSPGASKDFTDGGADDQSSAGGVVCIDNVRNLGAGNDYTITEKTPPSGYFGDSSSVTQGVHSASTCADRLNAADGTIKDQTVASTALAAASAANATNLKVTSVAGMAAGQVLSVDTGADLESRIISTVGTAGAAGTGVTLTTALTKAHANLATVTIALPVAVFTNTLGSILIHKLGQAADGSTANLGGATFKIAPDSRLAGGTSVLVSDNGTADATHVADTSSVDGVICVDGVRNLGAGNDYTVTEDSPPSGWFKDASSVTVGVHSASKCSDRINADGTLKDGQSFDATFTNKLGSILIHKLGQAADGTTSNLTGATFKIAPDSRLAGGTSVLVVDNGTADATHVADTSTVGGVICVDGVRDLGTGNDYTVTEDSAPTGWFKDASSITVPVHSASKCSDRINADGTLKSGQSFDATFTNKLGSILIHKLGNNAGTIAILGGATFKIAPDSRLPARPSVLVSDNGSADTTHVADTSSVDGVICVDGVRDLGTGNDYTVTEDSAPTGWFKDASSITVGVHSASKCSDRINADGTLKDGQSFDATFTNVVGSILIHKLGRNADGTTSNLGGATFQIAPDSRVGKTGGNVLVSDNGTADTTHLADTSSVNGVICVDGVRDLGAGNNYTVTESSPPTGWFGDASSINVPVHSASKCSDRINADGTLKDGQSFDATFTNIKGSILIKKVAKDKSCTAAGQRVTPGDAPDCLAAGLALYGSTGKFATFKITPSPTSAAANLLVTDNGTGDANSTGGYICIDNVADPGAGNSYTITEDSSGNANYTKDTGSSTVLRASISTQLCSARSLTTGLDATFTNTPLSKIEVLFTSSAGSGVTTSVITCKDQGGTTILPDALGTTLGIDQPYSGLPPNSDANHNYTCTINIDP